MILLVSSTSSLPSSNPPDPTRLQMLEGTSESQPASPALSRLADFGRARVRPRIILHCLPSKIEKNIIRKCQKMSSPWWKNTFYVWFFFFYPNKLVVQTSRFLTVMTEERATWRRWRREELRNESLSSVFVNPTPNHLTSHYRGSFPLKKKKKMIKTFFFSSGL